MRRDSLFLRQRMAAVQHELVMPEGSVAVCGRCTIQGITAPIGFNRV